jgi:probable addiction module antidote protein
VVWIASAHARNDEPIGVTFAPSLRGAEGDVAIQIKLPIKCPSGCDEPPLIFCNRSITDLFMAKPIKTSDLRTFDAADYLGDDQAMADYLTAVLDDGDAALLAAALGDIARARGMTNVAKSAGLTREALYKALRADSAPRFDTIQKVCGALGIKLVAQPVEG